MFWRRLFRLLARFLIKALTELVPGPAIDGFVIFRTTKGAKMGEITVRDDEATLHATVSLVDSEGQPTTADTTPTWEVSDENVLTVHPSDDGLSATFDVGGPGAAAVTVRTTETNDGQGDPVEIILTGLVTVIAGNAVGGSVDFATG